MQKFFLLIVLLMWFPLLPADAQDGLNPDADPNFGTITLNSGFAPDPYITTLTSGGDVDISALGLSADCRGFATLVPDIRLEWTGSSERLRLFFVSQDDTTLVITTPSGDYACNDDGVSLNPVVDLFDPEEGTYAIWVGSYSAEDFAPGYLMFTELESAPQAIDSPLLGTMVYETSSNPYIEPNLEAEDPAFGSLEVSPDFSPDPHVSPLILSGGSVNMGSVDTDGAGCIGYSAEIPDYRITVTEEMPLLRLFFLSDGDTTLIIHGPDGEFYCNDDAYSGLNPAIDLNNVEPGVYDVWVGSYSGDQLPGGRLYITGESTVDPSTINP